ncbi:MAG: lipoprotein insertase outer membrane protein LolB [Pseudomonadota bacterium]
MRWFLLAVAGIALAGCATRGVQQLPLLGDWETRQQVLSTIDNWSLRGRVGIRTPEEASSASLSWTQQSREFNAELDGPLGIGGLRMQGNPRAVTLTGSRIDTVTVADPETELLRQTGVRVPVSGLRYWLLGVPMPGVSADVDVDEQGTARQISQSGWTIRYTEYRRWELNALPRKIEASYADTRLTVIIRDWDIAQQAMSSAQR